MTEKDIRPIPKYIIEKIRILDKKYCPATNGHLRYYAYLAIWHKELVKVTVAVRHKYNKWYYKQCAVHGIDTEECLVKDMAYSYIGGYYVGWFEQGLTNYPKWYESPDWGYSQDKYFDPYAVVVNKEVALKIPEFKYSAIELYHDQDVLQYLRRYRQYPQIEYLTKLGFEKFTDSKMILSLVGKDKRFIKWLIQNKADLLNHSYDISVVIRAYKQYKPLDRLQS